MIALWGRPHRLLVKDEPSQFGGVQEFRAQTASNGCKCKEIVSALADGNLGLEFNMGNSLMMKNPIQTASFKLGSLDIKFCPFCGKSAKLLMPRTEWKSKAGEKTRI